MRVALVSESFLPQVNGVSHTVRHVLDRLLATGHQPLVIAPGPGLGDYRGVPVVRTRSVALPAYRSFGVGLPDAAVERALAYFEPDVVHLASPALLGAWGARAARRLGVPSLAVYQTDVSGFSRQYGIRGRRLLDAGVAQLHGRVDRTLVPSSSAYSYLEGLGVPDLHLWRRGVDLDQFHPRHRDEALHHAWTRRRAPGPGQVAVGYVGRLAHEKQVRRLVEVAGVPGVRLVVVGDGPERPWLERHLPGAVFTGMLTGRDLSVAFASLDVFVHTGTHETFCQTVQEAQASGVPVVVPARGGPLDLVSHGVTGLLHDPREPSSLRRTVATLVGDAHLRRDLAAAAGRAVQGRSWTGVVDELVASHYAQLASVRRRSVREAA